MKGNKNRRRRLTAKREGGFKLNYLLIFLAVISLSSLYVWQRITVVALATSSKELKVQIKSKQDVRKYLQIEVTKLSSIERIEKKAERMGLAYPSPDGIGWIRESSDSVYLETRGITGNIWAKLKTLHGRLLPGDEAVAGEIKREP